MTMTTGEQAILHRYLDNASTYLEFGSGESTVYAANLPNLNSIDSVESSKTFIEEALMNQQPIKDAVQAGKLSFHIIDIGRTRSWGHPIDKTMKHLWPNYSAEVFRENKKYDLVLIDGRFRVACAANAILNTGPECPIIIHDFWNRSRYNTLLKYLDVVEKQDTMGVFKRKKDISDAMIKKLLEKYQYLPHDKTIGFRIKEKTAGLFGKKIT